MKPKTRTKLEQIASVKLYREDLEAILSMFRTYCEAFTISDANFEYESLDDLKNHVGSRVRNIEIVGTKPSITLTLMRSGSWIRHIAEGAVLTTEETDNADLLLSRVKDLLSERKRLFARIATIPAIVISGLAVAGGAFLLAHRYPVHGDELFALISIFGVIGVVFLGAGAMTGAFRYVTLDSRTTASSFWSRNRDDLLKLAIGTAIGIVVTLVTQFVSRRFK